LFFSCWHFSACFCFYPVGTKRRKKMMPKANVPNSISSKRELRIQLRSRRRSLSRACQRHNASCLASHLQQLPELQNCRHIAVYWPNDGEIDPRPFIACAAQRGVQIYLPVITGNGQMRFAAYEGNATLRKNRFGIPEPQWRRVLLKPLWQIDVILMPLVGFDSSGNRLGMGAGFYDRALADAQGQIKQPQRWGLAHSCQQVESLPRDDWDMPLQGVITERGVWRFSFRR
jgi:5-formyltetrahydrofolate cyclo-ligase